MSTRGGYNNNNNNNRGGGGGGVGSRQQDRGAPVIDLEKLIEKRIRIRFSGGREVVGTLKGFDGLVNAVLDDTTEFLFEEGADSASVFDASASAAPTSRYLGLVVCRGTNITVVGPDEGFSQIANPFLEEETPSSGSGGGQ